MQIKPSPEEISEWLELPVSKLYFKTLLEQADIRRKIAGSGNLIKDTAYETGEVYIKAMIQAEVYEACANPTVENLLEEFE